jgi:hypothetical protein
MTASKPVTNNLQSTYEVHLRDRFRVVFKKTLFITELPTTDVQHLWYKCAFWAVALYVVYQAMWKLSVVSIVDPQCEFPSDDPLFETRRNLILFQGR